MWKFQLLVWKKCSEKKDLSLSRLPMVDLSVVSGDPPIIAHMTEGASSPVM